MRDRGREASPALRFTVTGYGRPAMAALSAGRAMFQSGYKACAAPKLNGVAIHKAFGLFDCLSVVDANQRLESNEMAVASDDVSPILFHPAVPTAGCNILAPVETPRSLTVPDTSKYLWNSSASPDRRKPAKAYRIIR
jgi:hypothetical protein